METSVEIRLAKPQDIPALLLMIKQLAEFEGLSQHVRTDAEQLTLMLFSNNPKAYAYLAFLEEQPVGYALLVPCLYVKRAQSKLILEDFYVAEHVRSQGIGKQLMAAIIAFAREHHYFRLEWTVLNRNEHAQRFYQRMGGMPVDSWTAYHLLV